ncbi:unnamed protein product, partial [Prorocentrum cordatum]
ANSGDDGKKPPVPRTYLKSWETIPKSFLNAYGRGKFDVMPTHELWGLCNVKQKTGAVYATELASEHDERRGVGVNRWLQSQVQFLEYLKGERVQVEACMKPDIVRLLCQEIDKVLPAMKKILAPKKEHRKDGIDQLRSAVVAAAETVGVDDLNTNAKIVWEYINPAQVNIVRATQFLFSGGGSSHVASSHHRAMLGFALHGNALHNDRSGDAVTLEQFQAAVRARHAQGPVDEEEPPHKKIKPGTAVAAGFQ